MSSPINRPSPDSVAIIQTAELPRPLHPWQGIALGLLGLSLWVFCWWLS